jgi:phosphohistidine swiveling domain-containing protein
MMGTDTAIISIDADTPLPDEAGGKARGLRLIARSGLPVPQAWVILPDATKQSIVELATRLHANGVGLLAVRSSAQGEDAERTSFAGIHESVLGVRPSELATAASRVALSALSDRAYSYREEIGLPPPSGPCAVVIQELIRAECAGVAFSADDTSASVVIEAVAGLGETAVNGGAVPETHLVRCGSGGWITDRRWPRTQATAITVGADGVTRVALPQEQRHQDLLDDSRASAIAGAVALLARHAGRALDVEWAWADGAAWMLQARPRTRPLTDAVPPGQTWTRANIRDVLPDLPSAFSRSVTAIWLEEGVRTHLKEYGVRLDPDVPVVTFIHGRPVFNECIYRAGDLLGVSRDGMQAEFGGTAAADNGVPVWDRSKALRHPMILLRATAVALAAPRSASAYIKRVRTIRTELNGLDLQPMTDGELVRRIRDVSAEVGVDLARNALGVAAAVANAQYPVLSALRRHPTPRAVLARLVAGGEPSVSTRQIDDLVGIAQVMRAWSGASDFTRTITAEYSSTQYWQDRLPPKLWTMIRSWLTLYGHRGPFESDVSSPRYVEDLGLLASSLFPLVADSEPNALAGILERRRTEAELVWQEVEWLCGRWRRRWMGRQVRSINRLQALRESVRSEGIAAVVPIRRMVLELGHRLQQRGRLCESSDVWHLSLEELERAVAQAEFAVDVAVVRELARRAAWRRIEVPNCFTSEEVASISFHSTAVDATATTLHGNGVSPGVVEGAVCVLQAPSESHRFPSGAVLVAPATDPGWTPIFARAVGVVVELGGALSHAGIVAREYGIPCVANIDGVTRTLRDGDLVRVDGSAGLVSIVSRAHSVEA